MLTQEQLRQELEAIAKRRGGTLKPEDVVDEARDPKHPLHGYFQWDDAAAANEHRKDQARQLIRSVKVEITTTRRTIESVFYVRDPDATRGESGYTSLPRLLTDKQKSEAAIAQEFGRALAALERARDIAAALGADGRVDDLIDRLRSLAGEVSPLKVAAG